MQSLEKISGTTKNIFYLILLICQAVLAYTQIYSNQNEIKQSKIDFENDLKLLENRSNKRYGRISNLNKDYEFRLRNLEAKLNYIKGKDDCQIKF